MTKSQKKLGRLPRKNEETYYEPFPGYNCPRINIILNTPAGNRIKITLYDYTGLLEVNFFNRLENNDSNIFDNFKYEGKREPVQIFGTLKVFHGKKIVQGAKLIKSNCSYVLYHRANVIHSWLYLTGKLKEKT